MSQWHKTAISLAGLSNLALSLLNRSSSSLGWAGAELTCCRQQGLAYLCLPWYSTCINTYGARAQNYKQRGFCSGSAHGIAEKQHAKR